MLTADDIVSAAARIVEDGGVDALTMRRMSEELGVAVTSIYWHVGNREQLLDALVDQLLDDIGRLRATGTTPRKRIAALARRLRRELTARPHLIGLVHDQHKTALMFQPVAVAIARELSALGVRGEQAALWLRALQVHVVGSALLERSIASRPGGKLAAFDADQLTAATGDARFVDALCREPDREQLFEYGLDALLAVLDNRSARA